ncbi:helix-turn-helix transcriptional regulator [Bacillus cereus]|nr:helix-turn-helix transcriptional regulator [Bacillus cereus]
MSVSKIKIARVEKGLTQQELANIVNVTRPTISLIESNKYNPSLKICIYIAKTLDECLDKLFWEEL